MILPVELIDEILSYIISYDNYCDLILINKKIYEYSYINGNYKDLIIKSIEGNIFDIIGIPTISKYDITKCLFSDILTEIKTIDRKYLQLYLLKKDDIYIKEKISGVIEFTLKYNTIKIINHKELNSDKFKKICVKLYKAYSLLIYKLVK